MQAGSTRNWPEDNQEKDEVLTQASVASLDSGCNITLNYAFPLNPKLQNQLQNAHLLQDSSPNPTCPCSSTSPYVQLKRKDIPSCELIKHELTT